MKRKTHSEFVKQLAERNPNVILRGTYINAKTKCEFVCKTCGYVWPAVPDSVLRGTGRAKCAGNLPLSDELFREKVYSIRNDFDILEAYENQTKKLLCRCKTCGREWKADPRVLLSGGGCRKCAGKLPLTQSEFVNRVKALNPHITPLESYQCRSKHVLCQCSICGHRWGVLPANLFKGSDCPDCLRRLGTSFPEQAIFYYLQKVFPDTINSYREGFGKSEIDIYIPSHKVGIEYDGSVWHKNKKAAEQAKYQICRSLGISLIRVCENEKTTDDAHLICDTFIQSNYEKEKRSIPALNKVIQTILHLLGAETVVDIAKDRLPIEALYYRRRTSNNLLTEFPKIAAEWHQEQNGIITPDMVTPKNNDSYTWKCKLCGYLWATSVANRTVHKSGCPKCSNRVRNTHEEFVAKVHAHHPNIQFLNEYYNSKTQMVCVCSTCGYKWQAQANSLANGSGCAKCAGNLRETHDGFIEKLKQIHPHILCQDYYVNTDSLLKFKCLKCGYEWNTTPYVILRSKNGCRNCVGTRRITHDEFITRMSKINSKISFLSQYDGANNPIRCKCELCSHEWESTPHILQSGTRCPSCHKKG